LFTISGAAQEGKHSTKNLLPNKAVMKTQSLSEIRGHVYQINPKPPKECLKYEEQPSTNWLFGG
jgi:hypothetical protein